jgi:hypothetical protein
MKKSDLISFVLILGATIFAALFVDEFIKNTRGWFSPSTVNMFLTLSGVLIVLGLFFFNKKHFERISIFYWLISIFFFIGYFGFIFFPLGPYDFFEGMVIGSFYTVGKYATYLVGVFILLNLPKKTTKV